MDDAGLASLNATLCAPNASSALPPLPPPDEADVVSPVVEVTVTDGQGNEVPVNGTQVDFVVPIDESKQQEVADKLSGDKPLGQKCLMHSLNCEWWDEPARRWSSAGCRQTGLEQGGARCTCTHLTVSGALGSHGEF